MALIEVHADLKRTTEALERIADYLEWLVNLQIDPGGARQAFLDGGPPGIVRSPRGGPVGPEAITVVSDERLCELEEEERRRKAEELGLPYEEEEEAW